MKELVFMWEIGETRGPHGYGSLHAFAENTESLCHSLK